MKLFWILIDLISDISLRNTSYKFTTVECGLCGTHRPIGLWWNRNVGNTSEHLKHLQMRRDGVGSIDFSVSYSMKIKQTCACVRVNVKLSGVRHLVKLYHHSASQIAIRADVYSVLTLQYCTSRRKLYFSWLIVTLNIIFIIYNLTYCSVTCYFVAYLRAAGRHWIWEAIVTITNTDTFELKRPDGPTAHHSIAVSSHSGECVHNYYCISAWTTYYKISGILNVNISGIKVLSSSENQTVFSGHYGVPYFFFYLRPRWGSLTRVFHLLFAFCFDGHSFVDAVFGCTFVKKIDLGAADVKSNVV